MMLNGIWASVSGMRVAQRRVSNSAHNVANASTSGFMPKRLNQATMPGGGVQITGSSLTGQAGPLIATGRSLDLAVNGKGFFALDDGNGGTLYTRSGKFMINKDGNVVDSQGRALKPPFKVPDGATNIRVTGEGKIQALSSDGNVMAEGQIKTANFANVGGLKSMGGNAFRATDASGPPINNDPGQGGHGQLVSGAIQGSGTDIAHEMVTQITGQRSFEANLKAVQTQNEMLGSILDKKT